MKKISTFAVITLMVGIIACTSRDKEAEQSVKELDMYVDSIERDHVNYYNDENYWTTVESKYEEKRQQIEAKSQQMDDKLRGEYAELQKEYDALKEKYNAERAKKANNYKMVLRNALFGEGVIGDDVSFNFMTAANAKSVYENFVNAVSNNKDNYSREDWDEIKVLYEAMDTRKNVIEKELSGADNRSIAAEKIRFAAIKAANRPGSKAEENAAAKE
ncbi:MAG: hypothetical protein V4651_12800 [Bacteroidota bacterium]